MKSRYEILTDISYCDILLRYRKAAVVIKRFKILHNRRVKYFVLGLVALLFGVLIYILFRPNTYISKFLLRFLPFKTPNFSETNCLLLKFYLADYLWAFSLACWLRCVLIEESKKIGIVLVSLTGILYEFAQVFSIAPGTADIFDCLLYVLAALTVNALKI